MAESIILAVIMLGLIAISRIRFLYRQKKRELEHQRKMEIMDKEIEILKTILEVQNRLKDSKKN